MKTALVTGGAGFLGSHLCKRLLDEGYDRVVAVDNFYTGSPDNVRPHGMRPEFACIHADVTDGDLVNHPLIKGTVFTEVYNLACPASPPHYQARPIFTTMTSVKGILFCLELVKRDGAKLLHTSTSEVYGDALVHPQPESYWGNVNTIGVRSCYDEGKRVAETLVADYIREYDVDARMVRIFNTYGPMMNPEDGRVVSNFIMQALRGEDLTIYGTGKQTRSFQYCDDLIDAFRAYMELDKETVRSYFNGAKAKVGGEGEQRIVRRPPVPVLNTGNPGEFTMLELAEEVLRQIPGTGSKLVYRPLPGDDPKQRKPDITLAKELLGWEPKIPLAEGLAKTIAYFKTKV